MRSTGVGNGAIGIEVLGRGIAKIEPLSWRPSQKILGGSKFDVSYTVVEASVEGDISAPGVIPERKVQRVEKASSLMTGSACIFSQCKASEDLNAIKGPPARALYRADGGAAGLASLKGAKLCEPLPVHTILFSLEPWNSKMPKDGLSQVIPSLVSA